MKCTVNKTKSFSRVPLKSSQRHVNSAKLSYEENEVEDYSYDDEDLDQLNGVIHRYDVHVQFCYLSEQTLVSGLVNNKY